MSAKTVQGSTELGKKIRLRRNELGFTIEEAAAKAGVGTKTWSRYEAGESIRRDKVANVCKALSWHTLPGQEASGLPELDLDEYQRSEAWPQVLADMFGTAAALSFVIGSDLLLDNLTEDLEQLSCRPRGTHIGELDFSLLKDILPSQFLMHYDYDFLYCLKATLIRYRNQAAANHPFIDHTVMDQLILYLIMGESQFMMEGLLPQLEAMEHTSYDDWDNWVFDLFGDMDILFCLYSDQYLEEDHTYHFSHWKEEQFYPAHTVSP